MQIADGHPALAAIREVSDEQLIDLERTQHRESGEGGLQLSPGLIHIAFGFKTDNVLGSLRHVLAFGENPRNRNKQAPRLVGYGRRSRGRDALMHFRGQ